MSKIQKPKFDDTGTSLCDGTVNDAAECNGLDSKVDDCTDMVEYNDIVAVQQNDTDTDIAKDDDTVAAQ